MLSEPRDLSSAMICWVVIGWAAIAWAAIGWGAIGLVVIGLVLIGFMFILVKLIFFVDGSKDFDFDAHIGVHFFFGGGVGIDGGGVSHSFIGEFGGIEACGHQVVIDKFCPADGEDEQGVPFAVQGGKGVDIAVDLEAAVLILLKQFDIAGKDGLGSGGGDGGIDDKIDVVEGDDDGRGIGWGRRRCGVCGLGRCGDGWRGIKMIIDDDLGAAVCAVACLDGGGFAACDELQGDGHGIGEQLMIEILCNGRGAMQGQGMVVGEGADGIGIAGDDDGVDLFDPRVRAVEILMPQCGIGWAGVNVKSVECKMQDEGIPLALLRMDQGLL
jgi:hypothetical protein